MKITKMNTTRFLPFGSHGLTGKTTHKKAILNGTTEAPWYTQQQFPGVGGGLVINSVWKARDDSIKEKNRVKTKGYVRVHQADSKGKDFSRNGEV